MRSVTTRFFAALLAVSVAALALGTWWVRHTVEREFAREVIVDERVERVDGQEIVRQTREERAAPDAPQPGVNVAALNRRLLIALSVVVLGAAVATALIARRVLGPVSALRAAVDRMAGGDATARVPVGGSDELAALGRAFNAMADALAVQEQAKRDLTNDIAHELRTPLTDLRCHLEALQDGVVKVEPETLSTLLSEVQQLQRLVEDLGVLARADARQLALAPESIVVADIVARVVILAQPRATAAGVTVATDEVDPNVRVWADPGRLQQVLGNLIDNAIAHTPAGGRIDIAARAVNKTMRITVRDTGPGIPAAHLPHVFDRFYRVDLSRSRSTGGAGLGLAIARQLVEASGGTIVVDSPSTGGATFTVTLPAFTVPS